MKTQDEERIVKVTTVTYPVASFTLKRSHLAWLTEQAEKRETTKSKFLRDVLDKAMKQEAA